MRQLAVEAAFFFAFAHSPTRPFRRPSCYIVLRRKLPQERENQYRLQGEQLADAEQRDALHCIRCGACLNVCPIFRNVGGQSYGTTYQGPIGSVITPHLRGLQDWKHLSSASSLCGACTETCPVKIDLHHHLLHNRRNASALKSGRLERIWFRGFAFLVNNPSIFAIATKLICFLQPLHRFVAGSKIDPLLAWTATREPPVIAKESFRQYWISRRK